MKLDYFTIRRLIRPREHWRKNENDWHMEEKRPHCSWELEQVMKIVSGKKALYGYTLESLQKRIDEK